MLSSTLMTATTLVAAASTLAALTPAVATFKARLRGTLVTIPRIIGCRWWCLPR